LFNVTNIGTAIIGTGIFGAAHIQALRRLGVNIVSVAGSSPAPSAIGAEALSTSKSFVLLAEPLEDPHLQVVQLTSPNDEHCDQLKHFLAAGPRVICEKRLVMTSLQLAEFVKLARALERVVAACSNTRIYPLNQPAYCKVLTRELGDNHFVTGHYHQDWLAKFSDWNRRPETDEGGNLRSVGDICTRWLDLTSYITGLRITAIMAEVTTLFKVRRRTKGPVETLTQLQGTTYAYKIDATDVVANMPLDAGDPRGVKSTSPINGRRKNSPLWAVADSAASAAPDSETKDHLRIRRRDGPNQILERDGSLLEWMRVEAARLPDWHLEGFAHTFLALIRQVYGRVAASKRSAEANYASIEDGHYAFRI